MSPGLVKRWRKVFITPMPVVDVLRHSLADQVKSTRPLLVEHMDNAQVSAVEIVAVYGTVSHVWHDKHIHTCVAYFPRHIGRLGDVHIAQLFCRRHEGRRRRFTLLRCSRFHALAFLRILRQLQNHASNCILNGDEK